MLRRLFALFLVLSAASAAEVIKDKSEVRPASDEARAIFPDPAPVRRRPASSRRSS